MFKCRICDNKEGNKSFIAREMQFGLQDEFEYIECAQCGCLQIKEIPDDLSKYYPKNYYSYRAAQSTSQHEIGIKGFKKRFIRDQITNYYLNRNSRLGAWLERKSSLSADYPPWMRLQKLNLRMNLKSSILDVGCGRGHLLHELVSFGFSNLTGVDPFIERDINDNGIRIWKKQLDALDQQFDFIMLHHSFEHMPEPLATLKQLRRLLKDEGHLLIRIPLAGSYAWRKYGINWMALDAPRHLHLHTLKSMKQLADQAGFKVQEVNFDAEGFGIAASEQYLKNIPLMAPESFFVNPTQTIFSDEELESFRKQDEELNKTGEADCAGFYLFKN